ncbi:hypothetical protein ACE4Z2_25270, partial [Salmonella enterica]
RLALWQAAALAGLPRAPSRFNPVADPRAASARTCEVLHAMVETGAIDAEAERNATDAIRFTPHPRGGWFADWAAAEAETFLPEGEDAAV